MKKVILIAGLSVMFLTACLDVVHYVSVDGNRMESDFRFTLQKAIFEMADGMSGEETDYGELLWEENEFSDSLPPGIKWESETIDTEFEIGSALHMVDDTGSFKRNPKDTRYIIPGWSGGVLKVVLPRISEEDEPEEADDMTAAFMASSKYRLLINRNSSINNLSEAYISSEGEKFPVSIIEFDSLYLVEFPMVMWFMAEDDLEVVVK